MSEPLELSAPRDTHHQLATIDNMSSEYQGRWNRLISSANWEKGRIIHEWRETLLAGGVLAQQASDEVWSRLVGGVTPQHVGRLRRVYERFHAVSTEYAGLYWSHFLAAVDWEDAEMWLEGASQNSWSVNHMRRKRWETLGSIPEDQPREEEVVVSETDEDYQPVDDGADYDGATGSGKNEDDAPFAADAPVHEEIIHDGPGDSSDAEATDANLLGSPVRPFEGLPPLPDDLNDALEAFKLVILRHRLDGWRDVTPETILMTLKALEQLVTSPAGE